MKRIHARGTINAINVEVKSAIKPIAGGISAPPTIAATINPESSLLLAGMVSTVILKINGKILAKPRPIRKMLIMATT